MRSRVLKTVPLGDLVVAAFDSAASYSTDPRIVSLLATRVVARMLRRSRLHAGWRGPSFGESSTRALEKLAS